MHLVLDRQVIDLPFAAAVDSPVQCVFDRTRISGMDRPGHQYLAISLSAADQYADIPAANLRRAFLPALAELFPAARDARVDRTSSPASTRPRSARARHGRAAAAAATAPAGPGPGRRVGDTGWPATMEGAVRSGLAAGRRSCAVTGLTSALATIEGGRQ